jgi:hypothetical protein
MELVPCPEVMVYPLGTDQVYEVAPLSRDTEYGTSVAPFGTVVSPAIVPGVAIDPPMAYDNALDALCPTQPLFATTLITPFA